MFDTFLTSPYLPFTIAFAMLFGLLLLELVFAFVGGSLLGAGGEGIEGPDIGAPDIDVADLEIDFDGLDIDAADLEVAEFDSPDGATPDGAASAGGIAGWLGFGKMPALIWLAAVLLGFGASGYLIQSVAQGVLDRPLPAVIVVVPAAVLALVFAGRFGAGFARILPKTETQSLSERHLGRRIGLITQGTAARGRPAEVRVTDRYGNNHYLRAEPLQDDETLPQGTEVLVLRLRRETGYLLVSLSQ
ncbi:OB-fold-containig protein [Paracoccus tegillarcae]|uniref:DUF1449 family protein n=1 Tax=Paracoccus tegillarcae TaxID=1529068 RepID=A0A2K9F4K5_9RHOB|nr:OB-fold-containig protein [Paracoccus tegillarcae]AUH35332.1 hypothetical protein CUV01_09120 [Paracoccus tegillarcae]